MECLEVTEFTKQKISSIASLKEIAGIRVPDSKVCREATELAWSLESPEVFLHSLRSFILAELIAKYRGTKHQTELLYVAQILHDIGLVPKHRSSTERFEVDSANMARAFLAEHGFSESDMDLVWDAIALHSSGSIARWKKPEVVLANAGIVTDVHGIYLQGLDAADVKAMLLAAPRTNFVERFLNDLAAVVAAKPQSTANTFLADVGWRMVPNFHLDNFVDEMRGPDPFVAFTDDAPLASKL